MSDVSTRLAAAIETIGPLAVAVSGGVDSLTLMQMAQATLGPDAVLAVHAASPAVPAAATARVRDLATGHGWRLRIIEADEFKDPRYRENPVNRCFFCKTNLYAAVRLVTDRPIVSGANTDDLGEYRPGLDAAREHGVRHPYLDAGIDKAGVRSLARALGLDDVASLPAAPCLSSRVETGLRIEPDTLAFIDAVERLVGAHLGAADAGRAVRCRVRAAGIVVELDPASLAALDAAAKDGLSREIAATTPHRLAAASLAFAPYRTGSAFLHAVRAAP